MSLFGGRPKASEVKVDGNRFTIMTEPKVVDVTVQSSNLPALRESRSVDLVPVQRTGVIPNHSWGA
jgi:hypothetical protein